LFFFRFWRCRFLFFLYKPYRVCSETQGLKYKERRRPLLRFRFQFLLQLFLAIDNWVYLCALMRAKRGDAGRSPEGARGVRRYFK
jgi:hypothetical protein